MLQRVSIVYRGISVKMRTLRGTVVNDENAKFHALLSLKLSLPDQEPDL
jgi:hypothetical protein